MQKPYSCKFYHVSPEPPNVILYLRKGEMNALVRKGDMNALVQKGDVNLLVRS